ncbi:hypothetical protein [Marinobacter sp. SS21]|uniref:hypothetical protein n=1 Tax=Marinobacter sp. SS21 TaxID=2979460 RepID=UPI00232F7254|nr:hypothetical protein [Marinobacter sp. SS21]MDC0663109.1 hypothetical protein [Marinobacter sp. SS21]
MTEIELISELHANTRRTRITYHGRINGRDAAIKCYRRPLFGFIHWIRAQRRGLRIRRVGGPVPEIVYSGWLAQRRCFCFATAFLDGYRPMREVLREAAPERQLQLIRLLGQTLAEVHKCGIEQPDGNLTNFLVNDQNELAMVDEDDIRVYSKKLSCGVAMNNLGNIAARLPDGELPVALSAGYLGALSSERKSDDWDRALYLEKLQFWRNTLNEKRASRNIAPRQFD